MAWIGQRIYLKPGVTGKAFLGAINPLKDFWWQHVFTCGHSPADNNSNESTRQATNCAAGTSVPPSPAPCNTHIDTTSIQGSMWCVTCNGPELVQIPFSNDPNDPVAFAFGGAAAWYEWLTVTVLELQYKMGANQDLVWSAAKTLVSGNNVINTLLDTPRIVFPTHLALHLTVDPALGNAYYNQPDCGHLGWTCEKLLDGSQPESQAEYGPFQYINVSSARFRINQV